MADSVDAIASLSGIKRPELLSIWEQVKRNQATLDACQRHRFVRVVRDGGPRLGDKYRCEVCGGEVDASAAHWYQKGQEHGRD